MKTFYQLEDFTAQDTPLSLTMGNFDGVHLGHQAILSQMPGTKVVLTFSNHPVEVLHHAPFYRLSTTEHRLELFATHGVDTTLLLPFTEAFSKQSARDFLCSLHQKIPFTHLILGHDALLGHERTGNAQELAPLASELDFTLTYLDPILHNDTPISSSAIRSAIHAGNFNEASALLGRSYSILAPVEPGASQGRQLGFRTANLNVHTLCLPPLGVYAVETLLDGKTYRGVANLGRAPTLHAERPPLLEVHLLDFAGDLYNQMLEVQFIRFLRDERRFDSIEALKKQIAHDIEVARWEFPT